MFVTATGHYVYIEATGAYMHHRAILESDMLPPLPSQVLDPESPYYKTCKVLKYSMKNLLSNYIDFKGSTL